MGRMREVVQAWDCQPQEAAELYSEGPLFPGLAVLAPLAPSQPMRNLVDGKAITPTGLGSRLTNRVGEFFSFGASSFADLQQPAAITSGTQPVTIAWVQEPRSPSAYNAVLNWKISGAANSFAIYQATSDASYYFAIGPRSGGSVQLLYASIGATTSGALDVFVLVCRGGLSSTTASDYSLYRNGVLIPSSGTTNFGANSASVFRVGALDSGGDPFEGILANLHIWSRALSEADARSWCSSPWQLLARRSTEPVPTGAGGGIVGSSSITLSAITQAAAGVVALAAASAITLGAITAAGSGESALAAQGGATLTAVTTAGDAAVASQAASSVTLGSITGTSAGVVSAVAASSVTLGQATSISAATSAVVGDSAVTLGAVTTDGAGTIPGAGSIVGSSSIALGQVVGAGNGQAAVAAQSAQVVGAVVSLGAGVLRADAQSSVALGTVVPQAYGTVSITAASSITLGAITSAGADELPTIDSTFFRYRVPAEGMTYSVAAESMTYSVPTEGLTYRVPE